MPEVTVKYKNRQSLKALQDLAKTFDMVIEKQDGKKKTGRVVPVRFAKKPNANVATDIWKDSPITTEELRKKAWGNGL